MHKARLPGVPESVLFESDRVASLTLSRNLTSRWCRFPRHGRHWLRCQTRTHPRKQHPRRWIIRVECFWISRGRGGLVELHWLGTWTRSSIEDAALAREGMCITHLGLKNAV